MTTLFLRRGILRISAVAAVLATCPASARAISPNGVVRVQWLNHLSLLSGDPSVTSTSALSSNSGVGTGLTALVVDSSTLGENDSFGGQKVVQMALDLSSATRIDAVRVCYELTSSASFISQVRLLQMQDPPGSAIVRLDDTTDLTDPGPACVDTQVVIPPVRARDGSVLLWLRVNYGDTSEKIAIRALGLLVR